MVLGSWLVAASIAIAACTDPADPPADPPAASSSDGGTTTDPTTSSTALPDSSGEPADPSPWSCPAEPTDPWFELGWDYKDGWIDLTPGGPITITVGGQGAWMVPLGVRGDGFCVPTDPFAYDLVPTLDVHIDAAGHEQPVASVVGFPVSFRPLDEGGLGYTFIPMILADELDPEALHGTPASIHAQLRPRDGGPLSFALHGELVLSE